VSKPRAAKAKRVALFPYDPSLARVSADFIAELHADLCACVSSEAPPPWFSLSLFDQLAYCLWRFKHRPLTVANITRLRAQDRPLRERRRKLKAMIRSLEGWLIEPDPSEEERGQLAIAISALQTAMAVMPELPYGDLFGRFGPREPPGVTIHIVGFLTLGTLRSADDHAGRTPRARLEGEAVAFIMRRLHRCLGDRLPDRADVLKILRGLRWG
jgi:hypothetical protein